MEKLKREEKIIFDLRKIYEQFGYKHYKMKKFEEYDLYQENKNFLSSENIITFNDLNGKLLALKPDVTLSIVKNANLSEKEKQILKFRYFNSLTQNDTARLMNMSQVQISRIEKKILLKLREKLS